MAADERKEVRAYDAERFRRTEGSVSRAPDQIVRMFLPDEVQTRIGELTGRLIDTLVELGGELEGLPVSRSQRARIFGIVLDVATNTISASEAIYNPVRDINEQFSIPRSYQVSSSGDPGDYATDRAGLQELSSQFRVSVSEPRL